ncbi:MAG: hypothetical protein AAGD25_25430 [Cyanobacteria bacterium P01_F01_bin.150]
MRHSDRLTSFTPHSINREPAALDAMETRFLERCRRNASNVPYPRHIPVPTPVTNFQRRGLAYQPVRGNQLVASGSVLDSTFSLQKTTHSALEHSASQTIKLQPTQDKKNNFYQLIRGSIMTQFSTATRRQRHALRQELNTVHRQNLQRRLTHRLEVARASGNEILIRQLEQEMSLIR